MEKYQYDTYIYDTRGFSGGKVNAEELCDELNRRGSAGWELVSSVSTNHADGPTRSIVFIFKRNKVS